LKFFQAPSFEAAVVFAFITAFSLSILFVLRRQNPPLPYDEEINVNQALPLTIVAVVAIYGIAHASSSVLGPPSTFLPQATFALIPILGPLLSTAPSTSASVAVSGSGITDFLTGLAWNFQVAAAEESFKVALVNLGSLWFARKYMSETNAIRLMSIIVVGIWTGYHYFQSIQTASGLIMAFFAGLVLIGVVYYTKNLLPSTIAHAIWNILASFLP
jgi:membrane protease YdiL (CAAX protease family)